MKTNAARLLDKLGIAYQILSYEVDSDDLAALSTAHKVGLPPEQVFKTQDGCDSLGLPVEDEPGRYCYSVL
jgi:hypothetical protein